MNASRILPDLQASLLCEDVRVESSGNFIIVGVISEVRVPQLPIAAYKLCVFNRWTAGIGEFNQEVRLVVRRHDVLRRRLQVCLRPSRPRRTIVFLCIWSVESLRGS
jgi:hypothetical protein